jgi:hypothetical protein
MDNKRKNSTEIEKIDVEKIKNDEITRGVRLNNP